MQLFNDDCFNVFPKIEDKTIDLFVLDLPYANKDFGKCTACKWDNTIDLDKMWVEIKRIMKPNAVILFYCNTKFGFSLIKSQTKWFRYDLIWKKSRKVGFLSANKMPLRQHENIYVFKEKGGTYNPQKTEGKAYKCKQGKQTNLYGIEDKEKVITLNKGDRHPTSIIEPKDLGMIQGGYYRGENGKPFKRMPNDPTTSHPTSIYPDTIEDTILEHNNPAKSVHRTQKPVSLCEWLIKTYSNEEDTVMDFTMGSGTTGEACLNTNRKFIGVEMDKDIFEIAKARLESDENL